MAYKYSFELVRSRIVHQIESDWPSNLEEWDEAEIFLLSDAYENYSSRHGMRAEQPEPGASISLARRFGIYKILPAAFYELSRCDVCNGKTSKYPGQSSTEANARGDSLSLEDFQILADYRDYLRHAIVDLLQGCNSPECRGDNCEQKLQRLRDSLQLEVLQDRDFLQATRTVDWKEHRMCRPCNSAARAELKKAREDAWRNFV